MEVDMRSESAAELDKLDKAFVALVQEARRRGERRALDRAGHASRVDLKLIGDRPSGQTSHDADIVQTAAAAIRAMGMTPRFSSSSTDSNIPISLGIPAITIGSGGRGGRAHALDEWIDVEKTSSVKGIQTAMVTLLTLAGLR